ncbi:MAG: metallophosphoesterase [Ruminococcus sp.]
MAKLVLREYTVKSERVRSSVDIALVSDLHERRAVDVLNLLKQEKPDLIAVAGDTLERFDNTVYVPKSNRKPNAFRSMLVNAICYVNYGLSRVFGRKNSASTQNAYSFLRQASNIAPVFLSLGNHETLLHTEDYEFFKKYGICLLDNEETELAVRDNFLTVGGLSTEADRAWLSSFARREGFRLLLCHHPEYYDEWIRKTDIDLILSGHNHGGQIRLFGKGLVGSGGRILPKYDRGLYDDRLVVSAGCANTAAIPRLFNPRELVIIHLEKIEKSS